MEWFVMSKILNILKFDESDQLILTKIPQDHSRSTQINQDRLKSAKIYKYKLTSTKKKISTKGTNFKQIN